MGDASCAASGDPFATTRWSVIARAQDPASANARAALAELCQAYWYPLYVYLRGQSSSAQAAEDLTQGFFVHLLEKDLISAVDRNKGKFRAFLLACCKHYLANRRDHDHAQKRGGDRTILSLDFASADQRYQREPADPLTPDAQFERRWAMTLLEQTLARLQQEMEQQGKADLYRHLQPVLTAAPDAARYSNIAETLGITEDAVKKNVQRLRERYGQLLRDAIAATVETPEQIDEEIQSLFAALASSGH
jgi:RNA polymerase sigma factor (sigma-70 family)